MDFLTNMGGTFSAVHILFNLILTLVLVLLIVWVYRLTHRGLSYSQSFISTLIMMSMITTVIMMVIGNNLAAAFGILGAFAIIRFRTVVKETRDISFIFFALAVGMAVGTDNQLIALIATIVLLFIIWVLHKLNFGSMQRNDYLLTFVVNSQESPPDSFAGIFEKYLKNTMLLNINAKSDGHSSEMVYSVRFIDDSKSRELVEELSSVRGVEQVHVISSQSDIEY